MADSGELLFGRIEKGKSYPISLDEEISRDVFALQYVFKPSNIDTAQPGSLSVADGISTVELPKNDGTLEIFNGISETCAECEYLLVFEDNQFKVVKVNTFVSNLKPVRLESRAPPSKALNRKNVTTEIKERVTKAKKRKFVESVSKAGNVPVIESIAEVASLVTGNNEISSLEDLFS